jgi:lipopolysaccharide transport system ATP-binding protein
MTINAIEAHGLSKVYDLGAGRGLSRYVANMLGGRRVDVNDDMVRALDNVSFSIAPGEAVGIIGSNGAGKSTLLKILSRVTAPSAGRGLIRGRVGSILEVGTGFHPELTGRENVFLNGAILGLRQHEVQQRLDSIVAFAGLERFLDTPVKRYSSGMYVRLAFAVAAHLDPDIMIVDEVLAVGDIGFQKQCIQRMDEETKSQGRTILFVSHNLQAIRALCSRALLFERGCLTMDGPTSSVVSSYLSAQNTRMDLRTAALANRQNRTAGRARFTEMVMTDVSGVEKWSFAAGEIIALRFTYETLEDMPSIGILLTLVSPADGTTISSVKERLAPDPVSRGKRGECVVLLQSQGLRAGSFAISACLGDEDLAIIDDIIDSNVNTPFLEIETEERDMHRRSGYFDVTYRISGAIQ